MTSLSKKRQYFSLNFSAKMFLKIITSVLDQKRWKSVAVKSHAFVAVWQRSAATTATTFERNIFES
jgi:hypothetical protein